MADRITAMRSITGRSRHRFAVVRIVRVHPRLFLSIALGFVLIAALPASWRTPTRLLVGWDTGIGAYLLAAYVMIWRSDVARMRRRAALHDEGATAILILTVGAA